MVSRVSNDMGPDELTQLVVGGEVGSADGRACFGAYFFGLGLPLVDGAVVGAGLVPPVRRTGEAPAGSMSPSAKWAGCDGSPA